MRKLYLFALLFIAIKASAQTSPVPDGYSLKTKDDYAKYEPDVIKTVDWLQQASWNEPLDNRKAANAFVTTWIMGSPTVNLAIGSGIMKLTRKNTELLMIYMGQYAKYALQHKEDFNADMANTAALRAMIAKYHAEPSCSHDSAMEDIAKLDQEGKLDNWVKTDFKTGS